MVSGSGAGEVVVLRVPELQFDRVAMQFGLAVRAVAVSSGARFIAAAGEYPIVVSFGTDTLNMLVSARLKWWTERRIKKHSKDTPPE